MADLGENWPGPGRAPLPLHIFRNNYIFIFIIIHISYLTIDYFNY